MSKYTRTQAGHHVRFGLSRVRKGKSTLSTVRKLEHLSNAVSDSYDFIMQNRRSGMINCENGEFSEFRFELR